MNRNELAKELNVWPWDIDDWLLWGYPAKKFRTEWQFDLERVKIWLEKQKVSIKRIRPQPSSSTPTTGPKTKQGNPLAFLWFKITAPAFTTFS